MATMRSPTLPDIFYKKSVNMPKQTLLRLSFQIDFQLHFWSPPPSLLTNEFSALLSRKCTVVCFFFVFAENEVIRAVGLTENSEVAGQDDDSTPFTYM